MGKIKKIFAWIVFCVSMGFMIWNIFVIPIKKYIALYGVSFIVITSIIIGYIILLAIFFGVVWLLRWSMDLITK